MQQMWIHTVLRRRKNRSQYTCVGALITAFFVYIYEHGDEKEFAAVRWAQAGDTEISEMSFMIYTAHQILGWITQGAWDRVDMKHA